MLSKVSVSNTRIFSYNDEDKEPAIITTGQNFNLTGGSIAAATAAKPLQSCLTLCHSLDGSPTRLPCPWDSPGKNTGVGCRFLLQGMKVKSESEVAQSCLTLSDPMDCSLPGSSVHRFSRQQYWSGVPLPSPGGSIKHPQKKYAPVSPTWQSGG